MGCSEIEKKWSPSICPFGSLEYSMLWQNSKCFYCSTKEQWKLKVSFCSHIIQSMTPEIQSMRGQMTLNITCY